MSRTSGEPVSANGRRFPRPVRGTEPKALTNPSSNGYDPVTARLPPSDVMAEKALIGAALAYHDVPDGAEDLAPSEFYLSAHQVLWRTMLTMRASGKPIDSLTVSFELRELGLLDEVGGLSYLLEAEMDAGLRSHVGAYARAIHGHALKRSMILAARKVIEKAYDGCDADTVAGYADEIIGLARSHQRRSSLLQPLVLTDAYATAEAMGEPRWLVKGLLGVESVHLLAAAAKAGKTWAGLLLAWAVATGGCWGNVSVEEAAPVLWIDEEMGLRKLMDRIGRLGMPTDLPMRVLSKGGFRLDSPPLVRETADLIRATGTRLVLIDSLRRVHGYDENDNSAMRSLMEPLQALAAAGCAVVVLHHHRKRTVTDGKGPDAEQIAGAGDLVAMVDVALSITREKNAYAIKVTASRLSCEEEQPKVAYELINDRDNRRVLVEGLDGETYERQAKATVDDLVLRYVEEHPGCNSGTLTTEVPKHKREVLDGVRRLVAAGRLRVEGGDPGRPKQFFALPALDGWTDPDTGRVWTGGE